MRFVEHGAFTMSLYPVVLFGEGCVLGWYKDIFKGGPVESQLHMAALRSTLLVLREVCEITPTQSASVYQALKDALDSTALF